jgi:hypothetical protein
MLPLFTAAGPFTMQMWGQCKAIWQLAGWGVMMLGGATATTVAGEQWTTARHAVQWWVVWWGRSSCVWV